MTLSEELVQAAAEAMCFGVCPEGAHEAGENLCGEAANVALQAAFAKLPECFKAEATAKSRYSDRQWAEGWNECLAALAREFGTNA